MKIERLEEARQFVMTVFAFYRDGRRFDDDSYGKSMDAEDVALYAIQLLSKANALIKDLGNP